jgi:hypothetical protein
VWDETTSGQGPAQVSNKQVESPYGETIKIGGGENGFGVRCYIKVGINKNPPCTYCFTKDELDAMDENGRKQYTLEPIHDQNNINWAVIYMKRKITAVKNKCKDCTATDTFIAAALGQGSGFTPDSMRDVSNPKIKDQQYLYVIPESQRVNNVTIDWEKYFKVRNNSRATSAEVKRFSIAVSGLSNKGWALPSDPINWSYISIFK